MRGVGAYKITNQIQWTKTIKYRRLKWFDHLCRLPEDCPAKTALNEILKKTKLPPGRPPKYMDRKRKKRHRKQRKFNIPIPKTVISS